MFTSSHPDMLEIEKAKKTLKVRAEHLRQLYVVLIILQLDIWLVLLIMQEHEQALMDVISKLGDAANSGNGTHWQSSFRLL